LKKNKIDYSLYLCTDRKIMTANTMEEAVEEAIQGGCTVIQLREKQASSLDFYETACRVKKVTDAYQVPLIINDRVDIAMAVNADGVHIGQSDLPAAVVRKMLGEDIILGVSVATLDQARKAKADGADYLGVGAMYATDTKTDACIVTMETLKEIREAVDIPIVVIGGINLNTAKNFVNCGINGIAVVSAILAQSDIKKAAAKLAELFHGEKQE
jgi:thiamine-phosphate pyrophosphorylase